MPVEKLLGVWAIAVLLTLTIFAGVSVAMTLKMIVEMWLKE